MCLCCFYICEPWLSQLLSSPVSGVGLISLLNSNTLNLYNWLARYIYYNYVCMCTDGQ